MYNLVRDAFTDNHQSTKVRATHCPRQTKNPGGSDNGDAGGTCTSTQSHARQRTPKNPQFIRNFDPEQYQQNFIKLRQPGTGIWLTDGSEFKQWMTSRNGQLWLYGIGRFNIVQSMIINLIHREAGAGKTILMYAVGPIGSIKYWV